MTFYARALRLCSIGLLLPILAACQDQPADSTCQAVGENLFKDTAFTTVKGPRAQRLWQSSEHSAIGSFIYAATDGVLRIEQTGTEPWMIITQRIDAGPLAGKVVEFSAEIKLDLTPPEAEHAFKLGGGLTLSAKNNRKLLVSSILDHEPHMGIHDWQTMRVVIALPRMIDLLQAGFLHQAGGVMKVRNPVLREMTRACPLTPRAE